MPLPNRYARNLQALSEPDCAALARSTVLVAGCGGLGGYVVESLARIGVGRIVALDCDTFDETNLNRQLLATGQTLGMPKAQAAAERAATVNPLVQVEAIGERLDENNARAIVKQARMLAYAEEETGTAGSGPSAEAGARDANAGFCVVDALDDVQARFRLAHACQEEGVPLVYGAVAGWYGQVCTVMPGDLSFVAVYGTSEGAGIEKTEGVLPFSAAAVAAFQSAEAVKALTGRGDLIRNRLLMIDALFGSCDDMDIES